ncbi:hypothetical protein AB9Q52_000840 (plasmid) [Pantoea vagans]|uniref:hypothetical protein n=1 Tax=Pantoea vagans TaxID=470934 RepID=UPI003516C8F3
MSDYTVVALNYIQENIKRMAGNSLLIKGWSMTLTGVALAITKKDNTLDDIISVSIVITVFNLIFWFMDSYYLQLERKFRNEYSRKVTSTGDAGFESALTIFNNNIKNEGMLSALFSASNVFFYIIVITVTFTCAYWK